MIEPYYEEDGVRLFCGDCREILPQLTEKFDLCLTDPPYGVDYAEWDGIIVQPSSWMPLIRSNSMLVTPGNGNQYHYPSPDWTACWFRPGSVQRVRKGTGFSHWEPILIYGKNPLPFDAKRINANSGSGELNHPCPKPLGLFKWLVESSTEPSDIVLDPFVGSGTTLLAAKQLGRRAVGIELSEAYCRIAVQRLSQRELFGIET